MAESKETSVWWGRKEQILLPKMSSVLLRSKLLAGLAPSREPEDRAHSLLRAMQLPPESLGDPNAKRSGRSIPDRVNSCSCLAAHSLRVPQGLKSLG